MTSQGPDPLSVRTTNFPQVGDHRVKKSAQSEKKTDGEEAFCKVRTYKQTQPQNSTLPENKGCLKRIPMINDTTQSNELVTVAKNVLPVGTEAQA